MMTAGSSALTLAPLQAARVSSRRHANKKKLSSLGNGCLLLSAPFQQGQFRSVSLGLLVCLLLNVQIVLCSQQPPPPPTTLYATAPMMPNTTTISSASPVGSPQAANVTETEAPISPPQPPPPPMSPPPPPLCTGWTCNARFHAVTGRGACVCVCK